MLKQYIQVEMVVYKLPKWDNITKTFLWNSFVGWKLKKRVNYRFREIYEFF